MSTTDGIIQEEEVLQVARQIASSENGCPCSGEDPPEPTPQQYDLAMELLLKEFKMGNQAKAPLPSF